MKRAEEVEGELKEEGEESLSAATFPGLSRFTDSIFLNFPTVR